MAVIAIVSALLTSPQANANTSFVCVTRFDRHELFDASGIGDLRVAVLVQRSRPLRSTQIGSMRKKASQASNGPTVPQPCANGRGHRVLDLGSSAGDRAERHSEPSCVDTMALSEFA
jgi:hypothetical protein